MHYWRTERTSRCSGTITAAVANSEQEFTRLGINGLRRPLSTRRYPKADFDLVAASLLAVLLLPVTCLVAAAIKISSRGSVPHPSQRIGIHGGTFTMFKFRTMRRDTPQVATHLLERPEKYLTPIGAWLRLTSIDEVPRLIK